MISTATQETNNVYFHKINMVRRHIQVVTAWYVYIATIATYCSVHLFHTLVRLASFFGH